jgi:thiaminase/transcriptional activator TenA
MCPAKGAAAALLMQEGGRSMSFSDSLVERAHPYVEVQLNKPFLVEIANGSLPVEKWRYYLQVDYQYLTEYAKMLSLGVTKAEDVGAMRFLSGRASIVLNREMAMQENYAAQFGLSREDLTKQRPGPIKYSYSQHELAAAYTGSFGELLAVLLPCSWNYDSIARALAAEHPVEQTNPYGDWIAFYSSEEHAETVQGYRDLIDHVAPFSTEEQRDRMEHNFWRSLEYEVMCWDAYYEMEIWDALS